MATSTTHWVKSLEG